MLKVYKGYAPTLFVFDNDKRECFLVSSAGEVVKADYAEMGEFVDSSTRIRWVNPNSTTAKETVEKVEMYRAN